MGLTITRLAWLTMISQSARAAAIPLLPLFIAMQISKWPNER
jgi:hypothetical protein